MHARARSEDHDHGVGTGVNDTLFPYLGMGIPSNLCVSWYSSYGNTGWLFEWIRINVR